MTLRTPTRAVLLFALALTTAGAQNSDPAIAPSVTAKPVRHRAPRAAALPAGPNLDVILLDPAHGGQDTGARLSANLLEKDFNLAFAQRLRSALAARGFTVVLTRESDPIPQAPTPNADPTQPPTPAPIPPQLTQDARAELSNRTRPLACLLLHATSAGRGVHLYTSSLAPVSPPPASLPGTSLPADQRPIQLWDSAQAASLPQSQHLSADLAQAVHSLGLPVLSAAASVGPIDSISCAAVTIELAPTQGGGGSLVQSGETATQTRLVNSIVEAMQLFRSQILTAQPVPALPTVAPIVPRPKAKPRPRPAAPASIPDPSGAPQ